MILKENINSFFKTLSKGKVLTKSLVYDYLKDN